MGCLVVGLVAALLCASQSLAGPVMARVDFMNTLDAGDSGAEWCFEEGDCNFHGRCLSPAVCACEPGWHGADCSWGDVSVVKEDAISPLAPEGLKASASRASAPPSLSLMEPDVPEPHATPTPLPFEPPEPLPLSPPPSVSPSISPSPSSSVPASVPASPSPSPSPSPSSSVPSSPSASSSASPSASLTSSVAVSAASEPSPSPSPPPAKRSVHRAMPRATTATMEDNHDSAEDAEATNTTTANPNAKEDVAGGVRLEAVDIEEPLGESPVRSAMVERRKAEHDLASFLHKRKTGCQRTDLDDISVFRETSAAQCRFHCETSQCVAYEVGVSQMSSGECFIHHTHCQEVAISSFDVFVKANEPTPTPAFVCANGDKTAEALMQAALANHQRSQVELQMGTAVFETAPLECQENVKKMFCEYNNQWRASPLTRAPTLHRRCPLPMTPKLNTRGNFAERCKLTAKPLESDTPLVRLGYVLVVRAKSDLEHVRRLLKAIDDPDNSYVVHVDSKDGEWGVEAVSSMVPLSMTRRVRVISTQQVRWGGSTILRAYLDGIEELRLMAEQDGRPWDYVLNLSGSDYPLLSQLEIRRFLTTYAAHSNTSFVDFGNSGPNTIPVPPWVRDGVGNGLATELTKEDVQHKVHRLMGVVTECEPNGEVYATMTMRRLPSGIDWREGSFWNALHRSLVESMLVGEDKALAGSLLDYFSTLSNPDETFFQTFAMNSGSCEHVCSENLRFENWHPEMEAMHPLRMSMDDVDRAMKQDLSFFARKFDGRDELGTDVLDYVDLMRKSSRAPL